MEGYSNQPIPKEAAKQLLALDLEDKEILTYEKLDQWYTAWNGRCYVSFSGGKDSTVLAYLAARYLASFRTPPWELNLAFVNTGLEYPEIQLFVNEYAVWLRREFPRVTVNLHRLRPKMNIRQVVTKYGYSIIGRPPSRGAWIEIAAHTAPRRSRPSPLRPVCPPGAPSCRPEKSSFVPSVVMYPVSFQLFVSPKNSFADFTWPFFSASE